MDPESKKLLEKTYELSKENNDLLRKVRRVQKRAALVSFLKVVIIIAISYGAFYYLEPYVDKLINAYNSIVGVQETVDNASLEDVLKKISK